MKDLPGLRDEDIDRLLSGKRPNADGFDDLAAFVQGVEAAYVAPPSPDATRRHVMAAAAAAREAAGGATAPAVAPRASAAPLVSRWRRRTVFGVSVATVTMSLTGIAITAAAATGGLAARGDLPAPIQRVVAQAASGVGITLPASDKPSGPSGPGTGTPRGLPATSGASGSTHVASPAAAPTATNGRGRHDDSTESPAGAVAPTSSSAAGGDHHRGGGDGSQEGGSAATVATHGNCVLYAETTAAGLGFNDAQRSRFVSLVAQDETAVTVRVAAGTKPDAACQRSIDTATAAVSNTGPVPGGGDDRSGSGHSPTPSPAPTSSPTPGSDSGHSGVSGNASPTPTLSPSSGNHGGQGGGN